LEWLRNIFVLCNIENKNYIDVRYQTVINKIKVIIEKYYLLDKDDIKVEYDYLFKYPQHLLDYFKNAPDNLQQFINKIEYMSYKVINLLDCLEFDLSTYHNNYEKIKKQELNYLYKKKYSLV
jgi:hypothetical protein